LSSTASDNTIRIGVVADTHVPDRVDRLHPELIPKLVSNHVSHILHAGDVCVPAVLEELAQVAPVIAVGGNRDWLFRNRLPLARFFEIGGISIALVHGHGGFLPYLKDKWYYFLEGYREARYFDKVRKAAPDAKVVVFGHTHQPAILWQAGQLFFNPGSASMEPVRNSNPSFGVLYISTGGEVRGEVIQLNGARLENRRWVPVAEGK
jgi:putative phosphoesterase